MYIALNLITAIIGSIASLVTIVLIYKMPITGHTLLILCMSWFQLMYDLTLFNSNVDIGYWYTTSANACQLFSGIGGSLASNFIAYIAFYVVYYRKSYDIIKNFKLIVLCCIIPSAIDTALFLYGAIPKNAHPYIMNDVAILGFYYYFRLVSIVLNFILFGAAAYSIRLMSSGTHTKSYQEEAISTLSRRMIYYPILQAISRSGYAWYEFEYGAQVDQSEVSTKQYSAMIFLTVITPTVSVGYLIIFLKMQPHAYEHFKAMCTGRTFTPPDGNGAGRNSTNSDRSSISRVSEYQDWGANRLSRATSVFDLNSIIDPGTGYDDRDEYELNEAIEYQEEQGIEINEYVRNVSISSGAAHTINPLSVSATTGPLKSLTRSNDLSSKSVPTLGDSRDDENGAVKTSS